MKALYVLTVICIISLTGVLVFFSAGCSVNSGDSAGSGGYGELQSQIQGYPISSNVLTTRQRTVVPVPVPSPSPAIYPYQVSQYAQYGYGQWQYGSGIDSGKQYDIMPDGYSGAAVTNVTKLLSFFTITDVHISDKESPCQRIYYGYMGGNSSAYSAVKLYTTQVLDAAVQTINALHKTDSFDFGIGLGDASDNTQYNEIRWYIDVLDGKVITPSSGNHAGADTIDYQKPYQAAGLDKSIPWYQALGNHDHFWMGSCPANAYVLQSYTGLDILNLGSSGTGLSGSGYYMGAIDGRTPYGDIMGVGAVAGFTSNPQVLAADPDRRSLIQSEWINEFFNTSSSPAGHGFSPEDAGSGFACYSFEPKSTVPIKVIVLDDTQSENGPSTGGSYAFGYLDQTRYDWLVKELDEGQAAGRLMIVAAHVPIGVGISPSTTTISMWSIHSPITQDTLLAKLHTYPNLLLWIAGHRHCNAITALKSPDANHPELGFWQIETSSLRDFPQQFRTFSIYRNSDNTISIITTDVDPAVRDGSPAAISRSYGIATQALDNNPIGYLPTGSYNAELVKQLSTKMRDTIKSAGSSEK